jgi:hypothetical protein
VWRSFLTIAVLAASLQGGSGHTLQQPFRESQQTLLTFGTRSFWLQPWRAYTRTVPAARLSDALGINFNPPARDAPVVARELEAAGFHRVRIEIPWCAVSDTAVPKLTNLASVRSTLDTLRRHDLRPLVLLNANEGCPGPLRHERLRIVSPAHAGDRTVQLDAASASRIVPGRTGLDATSEYKAAAFIVASVSGRTGTLAKPLDHDLRPGVYAASTLRYAPFPRPRDPGFDETMDGWLAYVGLVTHTVERILGSQRFDVEVWNELSFGSDFLDVNEYYSPPRASGSVAQTERAILQRTVDYIRDPAHGVARIGVGDGFANERPWEAGSTEPAGVSAIDKHPYVNRRSFPADAVYNGVRPLDALGRPAGVEDAEGRWHDAFVPRFTSFFPEYFLSGIQTENVVRDLSPFTTSVYGTLHGRSTHPAGSAPPAVWLTEAGLDPAGIPARVLPRFKAKELLRWSTAWVSKGAAAVDFYAASSEPWALVDPRAPGGGLPLRAVTRLNGTLGRGRGPITRRVSLQLAAITDSHAHVQFAGNGTSAYPPLYDRDVVGFFPFQVSNRRAVVALYVMTRDLMHAYRARLPVDDPRRYDLPPEWFRLTVSGTTGLGRSVRIVDPLDGRSTGVRVVARSADSLVVDVALTDSPRLLELG